MKKLLLIGQTNCGKTTLCQYLHNLELSYKKTQQINYFENSIDTPGEFLENRFLYNALISTSIDADYIAFMQSIDSQISFFPPSFAMSFTKPAIGIISKIDRLQNAQQLEKAENCLKIAGATKIFPISTTSNQGLDYFSEWLLEK